MKRQMLAVFVVFWLGAIALAQNASPLLLQNLPAKTTQSVLVTSGFNCDCCTCTNTGQDVTLTQGLASGGNLYDSKGNFFLFRGLANNEYWMVKPNGSATKFADTGVTQSCTSDSNGATEIETPGPSGLSFNLMDNSLRVVTQKTILTGTNGNGWAWGCDSSGNLIAISQGTGNPQTTNATTFALLKITGTGV